MQTLLLMNSVWLVLNSDLQNKKFLKEAKFLAKAGNKSAQ